MNKSRLQELSDTAAPSEWFATPPYENEFDCEFVGIGPYPLRENKTHHYEDTILEVWGTEYDAPSTAAFICELVNAYRAGKLIEAEPNA